MGLFLQWWRCTAVTACTTPQCKALESVLCRGARSPCWSIATRRAVLIIRARPRNPPRKVARTSNALDAYGALLFSARQLFVNAHRVAMVGASQGGTVALSVAEDRRFALFINPDNLAFRGAVAFYPWCLAAGARPAIPTLILVGEIDDWPPAKDCVRTLAPLGSAGPPIELVTYPGAPRFQCPQTRRNVLRSLG
jgi:dienelactone hydrolase